MRFRIFIFISHKLCYRKRCSLHYVDNKTKEHEELFSARKENKSKKHSKTSMRSAGMLHFFRDKEETFTKYNRVII